jgi:uridine phosphorylase
MVIPESDDYIIHPRKTKNEKSIPENGLLLVNPTEAQPRIKALVAANGRSQFLFNSSLSISQNSDYFLAGPAIGAPIATMAAEKLFALGAKKLILCGWCGALDRSLHIGDIVIPDSGFSGEGTSKYYVDSPAVTPSQSLSNRLVSSFEADGHGVSRGRIWSTDAIYREHRDELARLRKSKKISAVDMEFTALCSVASVRKVQFAAVLIVSDEIWGKSWRPGFSNKKFQSVKDSTFDYVEKLVKNL